MNKEQEKGFVQGIVWATAEMAEYGEIHTARTILYNARITYKQIIENGNGADIKRLKDMGVLIR